MRPAGVADELRAALTADGHCRGSLTLYRTSAARGRPENRCRPTGRRIYASGMGKRHLRKPQPDLTTVLDGLRSPDEQARVKALHAVCPCTAGFRLYEQFRGEVRRLQKDPSPRVRAIALHVEQDAGRLEEIEATLDRASQRTGPGECSGDRDWLAGWERRRATRYWLPL
jgi:hypothetical protein